MSLRPIPGCRWISNNLPPAFHPSRTTDGAWVDSLPSFSLTVLTGTCPWNQFHSSQNRSTSFLPFSCRIIGYFVLVYSALAASYMDMCNLLAPCEEYMTFHTISNVYYRVTKQTKHTHTDQNVIVVLGPRWICMGEGGNAFTKWFGLVS